ncbi:hypothetical protein XENOCAPTIV_007353 [Xenoophorus captivus]|uniref:Uncharacterized protein n=1 Tax=Xenoophorus captivus TaxID=1517983 RepID=A0ABV0S866_9TELE
MPCPYGPEGIRQIQKGGRREELKGVSGGLNIPCLCSFCFLRFYHGDCTGVPKPRRGQERGGSYRELPSQEKKNGSSCVCCTGISPGLHHPLTPSRQQFKNERSKL